MNGKYECPPGKSLVIRTCDAERKSHGGFQWPESGPVECPDWDPKPECGNGLHGLLWAEGNGNLLNWSDDAKWLVVEVDTDSLVDIGGKAKFPRGNVVYCGDRSGAIDTIGRQEGTQTKRISGSASNSGDRGSASNSGYSGSASNSGYRGSASNSGDSGSASNSGYRGSASNSGDSGIAATFAASGKVSGSKGSVLVATWWDTEEDRPRVEVCYVGENGIKEDTWYQCQGGNWVDLGPAN